MHEAIEQAIALQEAKLLAYARRINPHLTADDLLQPNDFPELEENPAFRYEEGVLHGLMAALVMMKARQ
jgi:hypothetical protein